MPRPLFRAEPLTLSTKKERERRGDLFRRPPRLPPRTCPRPRSRIFPGREGELLKAQLVSFQEGERAATGTPLSSAAYDSDKVESYFDQAFLKEDEIGAGDFGRVFRVRSRVDQKVYAVKIARERYRGPTDRTRKLEEVRKHQFLPPHSTIVKFHRSWEEQGRLYQQFELCNGTLQELAESQDDIPQSTVWSYLVDLLQALQHLHEHNHIHMDIKPENIFIGRDGICKVGDFGLMLDLAAADAKKQAMEGDSRYLAPEALQGRFTKACDVFSLGITMLELACNLDLPMHGDLWQKIRMEGPDPASTMHLQPELRRVLLMMMTSEEERRPCVRQLLELPSVRSAVRSRGRQILIAKCRQAVTDAFTMGLALLRLLFSFLLLLINPLFDHFAFKSTPSTPGRLNASLSGFLDALQEGVEFGVEGKGPCTVDNPALDVGPKVHLHDIIVLKHSCITSIWGVMCSNMVSAAASGKSKACLKSVFSDQCTARLFQLLADVNHLHPWLHPPLNVLSRLSVSLRRLSDLIVHIQLQAIYGPRLLRIEPVFGSGVRLSNWVLHYLTLWELAGWEKVFYRYRWWICLDCSTLLLFVGLFLLA